MTSYTRKSKPRIENELLQFAKTKGAATRIKRACRAAKKLRGDA